MLSHNDIFLQLIRLGVGNSHDELIPENIDWTEIEVIANSQGLLPIVVDGIESLPVAFRPPKAIILQWIGESLQQEQQYAIQQKAAADMALLFHANYIRTYVLKGAVISECYPNASHRICSDMDCYLLPSRGEFDAWLLGNDLIKANGYEVTDGFYKNSTFFIPGLMVENHRFFTPFRGNSKLKSLERVLQVLMSKY